jgi:hypothetical protein
VTLRFLNYNQLHGYYIYSLFSTGEAMIDIYYYLHTNLVTSIFFFFFLILQLSIRKTQHTNMGTLDTYI